MKKKMKTVYSFLTFISVVSLNAYITSQVVLANEVTTQSSEQETATTTSDSTTSQSSVQQSQAATETASVLKDVSNNSINDETSDTSKGSEVQQVPQPSETSASSEKTTETSQANQAQTSVGTIQAVATSAVSTSSVAVRANTDFRSAVNAQPAPEVTTLVTTDSNRIALQYTGQIPAGETIKFAVWSDSKGQDDLVWYQADVTGLAYLQLNRHKSYGLYHLHTYSFASGRGPKGLKNQTFNLDKPQPKVRIEQTSNTNYRLTISEVGPTISHLKVPIWSGSNGQDDIKWYPASLKADGTYQLDISVTNHKSNFGKYYVHVYGDSIIEGKMIALAATNGFEHWDNRPEPEVKLVHTSPSATYFDVRLDGKVEDRTVKEMAVAVWSVQNDQDDLKWYRSKPISNKGGERIWFKNHANESDQYHVHVYLTYHDGRREMKNLGPIVFEKPATRNEVNHELIEKGLALQLDSNEVTDYTKVRFAVWSQEAGQDDLKWYAADKNGSALAAYQNHKGYGLYHIHTYTFETGKPVFLHGKTFTIEKPQPKVRIEQTSNTNYRLTISEVGPTISHLKVPIWSGSNGQDDIKWYPASPKADGTYQLDISVTNHKSNFGKYYVHVYGDSIIEGKMIALAATNGFEHWDNRPEPEVKLVHTSPSATYFDVRLDGKVEDRTVKEMAVAVWSVQNDQDDLKWYRSKPISNKGGERIWFKNHANESDQYHVHVYLTYHDGRREMKNLGPIVFEKPATRNEVNHELIEKGLALQLDSNEVTDYTKVRFAVWSQEAGQDDLKWYAADKNGSALAAYQNHKGYGLYHIHTYTFETGKPVFLHGKTFTIEKPQPKVRIEQTSNTNYRLTISEVGPTISHLKVPIWSGSNGQDDIKWYPASPKADGTYQLDISVTNHKSNFGKYYVHVYGDSIIEGKMIALAATNGFEHWDNRPEPEVKLVHTSPSATYFDVRLDGKVEDRTVKEMAVAVWSVQNDQDDLKWYRSKPISNKGGERIWFKNHANESDQYHVHVYLTYHDGRREMKNLGPIVFEKPATRNEVNHELIEKGLALQLDSNEVTDYTKVRFAVWSQEAGQDDLKWYAADKNGSALAAYQNHKGYGLYHIHTYTFETGKPVFLHGKTFTIDKPSVTTKVEKVSATEYRVTISDVPYYLSDITVPVWSTQNGQDDLVWTPAKKVGDKIYQASIHLVDHRFDLGQYYAHVYGNSLLTKKREGLGTTEGFVVKELGPRTGSISVSDVNLVMGTFKVTISNISSPTGLQSVMVPIWSNKNGQDDIIWYQAKKGTNGTYTVDVAAANHKYTDGIYSIHLYYKDAVGKLHAVATSSVTLNLAEVPEKLYTIGRRKFKIIGTFAPSYKSLENLSRALDQIEGQGYGVGFKLMDINSRMGIEYNAATKYYGASTIKGPYVASLASQSPATTVSERQTMLNILRYSSNEGYASLRTRYGSSSLYNWGNQAGIPQASLRDLYPYLSANDLFGLWHTNYKYFNSSAKGREVGSWFENPNLSPIHSVLGSGLKTQTKAGWIGLPGYRSASDGGIVYTPKGNYIVSIMSNADGRLGLLNPTVSALHAIHQQIKP